MRKFLVSAAVCLCALTTNSHSADLTFSTSSRAALFQSQLQVLDSRAATQYANSVRLQPKRPFDTGGAGLRYNGSYKGQYLETAKAAAVRHGVPTDLFLRLVQQESRLEQTCHVAQGRGWIGATDA